MRELFGSDKFDDKEEKNFSKICLVISIKVFTT